MPFLHIDMTHVGVPTLFQKWISRIFQGLSKDKITFFKHYRTVFWQIVWLLFCDKLTCHTPNCNIYCYFNSIQPVCCGTVPNCTMENMDRSINSDRDLMTKLQNPIICFKLNVKKMHKQIGFFIFFQAHKVIFKHFSRKIVLQHQAISSHNTELIPIVTDGPIKHWLYLRWDQIKYMKWHDDVIKLKHFPLLALCAGNSPVNGEFPSQRPVTWSFDVFFDLCLE